MTARTGKPRLGMLVGSMNHDAGGVAQAVRSLVLALRRRDNFDLEVFSLGQDDQNLVVDGIPVHVSRMSGPRGFGYAPDLLSLLGRRELDCLHVHGIWLYLSVAARKWAQRTGRPYVVSPHGMLDDWALANQGWKKRIARQLYEDAHVNGAACIHALCEAEARSIVRAGYERPIAIIPNGVDQPIVPVRRPAWHQALPASSRVLLFLGRVTPKKRVAALIEAWAQARTVPAASPWHLVIVGPVGEAYEHELNALVEKHDLASTIHFTGPAYGDERSSAYAAADAFVLPSMSEGLPMAVLEALGFGLPVLITPQCNIPEAFGADAAIEIAPDEASIREGLVSLFEADDIRLARMAENGRRLVRTRFNWTSVAADFEELYSDCLSGAVHAAADIRRQEPADKLQLSSLA